MLQKLQKRKSEGFTIIEVLIVLAIAGLIMLVVFLAVPALQRNTRNNQYRAEANRLLAAYSEVVSNNGGQVLTYSTASDNCTLVAADPYCTGTGATQFADTVANAAKLQNISAGDTVTIQRYAANVTPALRNNAGATTTQVYILTGTKCATPTTYAAGSTRQFVVLFNVETSSGVQMQCQES